MNDDCGGLCETDWYHEYSVAQKEISRLRALAVRVKQAVWTDLKYKSTCRIGELVLVVWSEARDSSFQWKIINRHNDFVLSFDWRPDDRESAKVGCHAEFSAWVWQFMEVGEQG